MGWVEGVLLGVFLFVATFHFLGWILSQVEASQNSVDQRQQYINDARQRIERILEDNSRRREEIRQRLYTTKEGYAGDISTKRPYPRKLKGENAKDTLRVRLYVQRDYQGSALYAKCVEDWSDMTTRGVLADWLEERGFAGAATNLRSSEAK
jgi:uncharacterized protein (TIGR02996 family)